MTLFPNAINATAYAIKLEIVLTNGEGAHGTGFLLLHKSQRWLVTCRHNIESAVDNLTGINEVGTIRSVLPAENAITLEGRAVVSPRVGGNVVDAVAIKLNDGEFCTSTPIRADVVMALNEDYSPPVSFAVKHRDKEINITIKDNFQVQGFPSIDPTTPPTTIPTYSFKGIPVARPWMIAYAPGAGSGFSGGPVLKLGADGAQLWAIHTHSYRCDVKGTSVEGTAYDFNIEFGGGPAIALLIRAIDLAKGDLEQIIDV